ncbi:MAG: hypothetical protein MZV64_36185 [Ignavibacteriales bacterium]|nr:hypothetical protein [Ignavibacteriales bacterium]
MPELLPEVDLFAGRGTYSEIGQLIDKSGFFFHDAPLHEAFPRKILTSKPSAYLKIQEGCNNRCTYCTVPAIQRESPEQISGRDSGRVHVSPGKRLQRD